MTFEVLFSEKFMQIKWLKQEQIFDFIKMDKLIK